MSLNTEYGGWVHRWLTETFNPSVMLPKFDGVADSQEGENMSKCISDVLLYTRLFGDPRVEWYGNLPIKVKDHWFPHFKKWAVERGRVFEKPEAMWLSMTIWATGKINLENYKYLEDTRSKYIVT